MEPADAAELIGEVSEEQAAQDDVNRFRGRAALLIAVIAAVLAVGGLGGGNATDAMIINTIRASDTWAFFQAKNVRQTAYEIANVEIQGDLAEPGLDPATRARLERTLAENQATIARYDSEPDRDAPNDPTAGEGSASSARARSYEAARDVAMARDDNFDWAEVLQIALVLGSVAILAINRRILILSAVLGAIGALLTLNGFTLLVALPI